MRRVGLALLLALASLTLTHQAHAAERCPQLARNRYGVQLLIRCAARENRVSTYAAMRKAWHESRYFPHVCNASDHCGVFQIYPPLWSFMVSHYVYGHQLGRLVRTNGRANVILALRYIAHRGWGPWR